MDTNFPFVSICTPTFNRRPFIPALIKSIEEQTYPLSHIEWIIVDDGNDPIEDLVKHLSYVTYLRYEQKITLASKRNIMNSFAKGEFIVYMDDDDYYPPTRIYHGVTSLINNPQYLIAGSSELLIYYSHLREIWKLKSFGRNHSTAATFVFRKELLNITKFNEQQEISEEKFFLKNYTIPLLQLDPLQTILVFSHILNTFDKKKLIKNGVNIEKTGHKAENIIRDKAAQDFYTIYLTKHLMYYKYIYLPKCLVKHNQEITPNENTTKLRRPSIPRHGTNIKLQFK